MLDERNALLHSETSFAYSKTFDNNNENEYIKTVIHEGLLFS